MPLPCPPASPLPGLFVGSACYSSEEPRSCCVSATVSFYDPSRRKRSLITLIINGKPVQMEVDPDTPLLWVLREHLNLTGTKYGCGVGFCGACTVHLNGQAVHSCTTPASAVAGRAVTTIEGL